MMKTMFGFCVCASSPDICKTAIINKSKSCTILRVSVRAAIFEPNPFSGFRSDLTHARFIFFPSGKIVVYPMPNTKIVATLGPATDAPGVIPQMLAAGVDVFRLNASHGSQDEHAGRIDAVRCAARTA